MCDDQKGPSVLPIIKYIKKSNVHIPDMAVKLYAAIGSKDITNFNLDIIWKYDDLGFENSQTNDDHKRIPAGLQI